MPYFFQVNRIRFEIRYIGMKTFTESFKSFNQKIQRFIFQNKY